LDPAYNHNCQETHRMHAATYCEAGPRAGSQTHGLLRCRVREHATGYVRGGTDTGSDGGGTDASSILRRPHERESRRLKERTWTLEESLMAAEYDVPSIYGVGEEPLSQAALFVGSGAATSGVRDENSVNRASGRPGFCRG